MRRMSDAVLTARGNLLEKYGQTLWVRFGTPVRIVDARPRHRGPNYLGWVHVDGRFTDTVRWISEPNFNRFYRGWEPMMRTVWKYSINMYREVVGTFFIPRGAQLVHVAPEVLNPGSLQEQAVSLWFEVDPDADKEPRVFEIFGTGHDIPESAGVYSGTAVVPPLVVHVYERTEPTEP